MGKRDKRVDTYIAKAAPFARPIMSTLRDIVHDACPDVTESMKWSRPAFEYSGMLCGMVAFKAHMTFGFWLQAELLKQGADAETLTRLDRMESADDLPTKRKIVASIKQAMALNEAGHKLTRVVAKTPKAVVIPPELEAALASHRAARAAFDAMRPSHQREYCEWVADAKREATKATRVEKAIAQLTEGKSLNWKYESC